VDRGASGDFVDHLRTALVEPHPGVVTGGWYSIVAASTYKRAYDELRVFLLRVGRMKLVLPVYRALASTPSGAALAREV